MYNSSLFDEKTFYHAFLADVDNAQSEVIIESPFITSERMKTLWPTLERAYTRGINIFIITRDPRNHDNVYEKQSEDEIQALEALGIQVLLCIGNHHRKLAIIDREILWEGSLNIPSQIKSRELMRRLEGDGFAVDLFNFIGYQKYL